MNHGTAQTSTKAALDASWARCERDYKLKRDTEHPILRLQSTEIAPRREALVEQIGGRHGIFNKLAAVAADAGQCLVMTDKDGILVRLESKDAAPNWNGIALGSVWDERVAGTNGVSMALSEGRDFAVRGRDHYFSQLRNFSCTAVPLRDAQNEVIGVANLSAVDRGNPADTLFAKQLLGAAASRLQHTLFEQAFKDVAIVSVAMFGRRELIKGAELVAVGEDGIILGATSDAHDMSGMASHAALRGERFDTVFGTDMNSLDKVPGRVMSVRRDHGPMLDLWMRAPVENAIRVPGWRPRPTTRKPHRGLPDLQDLTRGCPTMKALVERAQASLAHGLPLLIEGGTGTGKSALASALVDHAPHKVTLNCATLEDREDDRDYIKSIFQQLRIANSTQGGDRLALIFDNIDEMPPFAQSALCAVLSEFEICAEAATVGPLILATTREPIAGTVERGTFREDLFYLLSPAPVTLPALKARGGIDVLTDAIAESLAGHPVDVSPAARDLIASHPWPGNVRELVQALQRALIHGDGVRISALDLGLTVAPKLVQLTAPGPRSTLTEEQILLDALQSTRWNVSKAARKLGMGRATIHRKIKAHGITRPA